MLGLDEIEKIQKITVFGIETLPNSCIMSTDVDTIYIIYKLINGMIKCPRLLEKIKWKVLYLITESLTSVIFHQSTYIYIYTLLLFNL